ncbi:MAG: hypothetical protein R2790_02380 [Flavobacterium haoranii]
MSFDELLEVSFNPANTILSVLLLLSVLYWILTIFTGIGEYDIDLDTDIDADTSLDNPDGLIEVNQDPSSFIQFLKFLNLDIIPITFFLTLALLFTWLINVNLSFYLPFPSWFFFITILPALIVSIFITKYVCLPLKPIFKEINHKGELAHDFLGRSGKLISTIKEDKMGMIEIIINKDPIKLMVKSKDGVEIKQGENAVIVDEEPQKKFYYVEKTFEI